MMNDYWRRMWTEITQTPDQRSNLRRSPTEAERLGWDNALTERSKDAPPKTLTSIRTLIKNKNPVRWWQLQRDFKWVQKEMKKMGLNPDDARYIL